ncbi:MAG: hypothetical protein ABIH59_00755 [archaeon]
MNLKDKKRNLKEIAFNIKHTPSFIKRILWFFLAIYYGGVLKEKYQKWFADKINWQPKSITILNALIFGVGWAFLYFFGRGEISSFFLKVLASEIAKWFNLTLKSVLDLYTSYNFLQNLIRIFYSQSTNRAIASFNVLGAVLNFVHWIGVLFKKKVLNRL